MFGQNLINLETIATARFPSCLNSIDTLSNLETNITSFLMNLGLKERIELDGGAEGKEKGWG